MTTFYRASWRFFGAIFHNFPSASVIFYNAYRKDHIQGFLLLVFIFYWLEFLERVKRSVRYQCNLREYWLLCYKNFGKIRRLSCLGMDVKKSVKMVKKWFFSNVILMLIYGHLGVFGSATRSFEEINSVVSLVLWVFEYLKRTIHGIQAKFSKIKKEVLTQARMLVEALRSHVIQK